MSEASLPTGAELAILNVLWARKQATVREVYQALGNTEIGYTTVLKTMQIMTTKGLVGRDESQRSHLYRPLISEEPTQKRLVADLVDRAFAGSASRLAMRALSMAPTSKDELAELRALLDRLEKKGGKR